MLNCMNKNFLPTGSDELFVGRAGYVMGVLWLRKALNDSVMSDKNLISICSTTVESGRAYAKEHKSPCPLMFSYHNTEYLGELRGFNFIFCGPSHKT